MKIELSNLADVDPRRVPLPNGTDVETRVAQSFGERMVPAGAVGRVKSCDGGRVVVAVVGVGELTYLRSDVAPRKRGQLQFAIRRESNWRALHKTIVLETVVGSRAWGLADESSDTDVRGVFVLPFPWTTSLGDPPTDLISADGSATYWEVGKAIEQGLRGDPNTLEMFHLDGVKSLDPIGQWLIEVRNAFVSKAIYGTFGRYALGQLKRLRQSLRLAQHRGLLLSWLSDQPSLSLDAAASRLANSADIEAPSEADALLRAKEYIKQLYSSLFDRGLLSERNFDGLRVFAATSAHSFELPRDLRPKNAYNLLRLIATASSWLRTGHPEFVVGEPLRTELLAIKAGSIPLASVLARADELAAELESSRGHCVLPSDPGIVLADTVLRRIRAEAARRWVEKVPGPWGLDAPSMPPLEERGNDQGNRHAPPHLEDSKGSNESKESTKTKEQR